MRGMLVPATASTMIVMGPSMRRLLPVPPPVGEVNAAGKGARPARAAGSAIAAKPVPRRLSSVTVWITIAMAPSMNV